MLSFIVSAVAISLSGVMAPGPVTAATLAAGARRRHAGAWIGIGHIAIELPLIVLLAAGVGALVESQAVRAGIGLTGGVFLLIMWVQLLLSAGKAEGEAGAPVQRHPFWTGVILTGANPYFWIWGATVGLTLTTQALQFGLLALAWFALIHWMCDLGWLEILSLAGFKGSELFGQRSQQVVSIVCAVLLLGFGLKYVIDAGAVIMGAG
jgi:threonine/homoserine/homoserine lactone efflux protein